MKINIIEKVKKILPKGCKLVCIIRFGSHLYGTNTEKSDTDFKGVFLPSKEMLYLNKVPKSISDNTKDNSCGNKNTKDDIDCEMYSLHYFLELACKGETVALDMIHANDENIFYEDIEWEKLVRNKEKFYTKNLKSFVGYAKSQAIKYSIKGDRLNAAKEFLKILKTHSPNLQGTLGKIWREIPETGHFIKIEDNPNGIKQYKICGKIVQETQQVMYAYEILETFVNKFGKRAEMAANNEGIDWKAMSHALRAALQTKEILETKNLGYPLKEAEFLKKVKYGELDFNTEVFPILENLIEEIQGLSDNSDLPEKADRKFWDKFILWSLG